jgi:DNA-directed RNA polymerase subunit beta'
VAELFEARRPKDHAIIAEIDGTVRVWPRLQEQAPHHRSSRMTRRMEPANISSRRASTCQVQEGDDIEKGDYMLDGNPAPHDILAVKGVEELAAYLVNEIQEVYRLQGVSINDKHIEVIVRQMLQKVEITDAGDSTFASSASRSTGSSLTSSTSAWSRPMARHAASGAGSARHHQGLAADASFISAASFQETTRVLTEAAVNGKVDTLEGLKENVIVGRLIPAGTGGLSAR